MKNSNMKQRIIEAMATYGEITNWQNAQAQCIMKNLFSEVMNNEEQ